MTWLQRYHLRRYIRWSLWIMPALAIGVVLVIAPLLRWLDRATGWSWFNFTPDGARTVLGAFTLRGLEGMVYGILTRMEPPGRGNSLVQAAFEPFDIPTLFFDFFKR